VTFTFITAKKKFSQEILRRNWSRARPNAAAIHLTGSTPIIIPKPISTLSYHLRLGLANDLLPSSLLTKILYVILTHLTRSTRNFNLIIHLDILIIFSEEYKLRSPSLSSFLHSPVTSNRLDPNILLRTLFSNTLNLCSSLIVRDQTSYPHKTGGIIVQLIQSVRF
jgi:hypothetical protein